MATLMLLGVIVTPTLSRYDIDHNYGIQMEIAKFFESEKYEEIMRSVKRRMDVQKEKERLAELAKLSYHPNV